MDELAARFQAHVLADVRRLKARGYHPTLYIAMIEQHGAVGAARRLLADPRHSSYGFEKLWEMGELARSIEFGVCLPWFEPLFEPDEVAEARQRLILHDFPLDRQLSVATARPPGWVVSGEWGRGGTRGG